MIYKMEWEYVPWSWGSPFYNGENPSCQPSEVPDEHWKKVVKETDNPWDQYNTLKRWAETGEQLIRNVQLFEQTSEPQWKPVKP